MWREGRGGRLRLSAECEECRASIKPSSSSGGVTGAPAGFVPAERSHPSVVPDQALRRSGRPWPSSPSVFRPSPVTQALTRRKVGPIGRRGIERASNLQLIRFDRCNYHF
jgi:hypothetical protein